MRQIRTSVSALQALNAIIEVDQCGSTQEDFDTLAELLIRTYQGGDWFGRISKKTGETAKERQDDGVILRFEYVYEFAVMFSRR